MKPFPSALLFLPHFLFHLGALYALHWLPSLKVYPYYLFAGGVLLTLHLVQGLVFRGKPFAYYNLWQISGMLWAGLLLAQANGGAVQPKNFIYIGLALGLTASAAHPYLFLQSLGPWAVAVVVVAFSDAWGLLPVASGLSWQGGVRTGGYALLWGGVVTALWFSGWMSFLRARRNAAIEGNLIAEPRPETQIIVTERTAKSREKEELMREEAIKHQMRQALEAVLFFMVKNFKAHNALALMKLTPGSPLVLMGYQGKGLPPEISVRPGTGILGRALKQGTGFVSGDLKAYPVKLEYSKDGDDIHSIMVEPIKPEADSADDGLMGLLVVDSENIRAFTDEHKELLARFTQIAGAMMTNIRLAQKVRSQAEWMDLLYQTTRELNQSLKVEEVFQILGRQLDEIFSQYQVVICLHQSRLKKGKVWKVLGADQFLKGAIFSTDTPGVYGQVLKTGRDLYIPDTSKQNLTRFGKTHGPFPASLAVLPIRADQGELAGAVGLESPTGLVDEESVSRLETLLVNFANGFSKARSYAELEKLATIDGLTQIPNHRRFQEFLEQEMVRCQRYHQKLTLLVMDIDHFKKFNDTYGHPVGDAVLKIVAATLKEKIRKSDFCARYGGEEFVVVLVNADDNMAEVLAERIRAGIQEAGLSHEGEQLHITVSIGGANFPSDGADKSELIEHADQAMYHSKENGRNQVTFHGDLERVRAN